MMEGSVLNSLRRQRAADCFTTSRVSLHSIVKDGDTHYLTDYLYSLL